MNIRRNRATDRLPNAPSSSDDQWDAELERERALSADLGSTSSGIPCEIWDHDVTMSQRVGTAAVMGVYGKEIQADEELIARALRNELSPEEIESLESLRDESVAERFGPGGDFGWAA